MAPQFDRALRERLRAAGRVFVRQGKGSHEIWHSPITKRNFPCPSASPAGIQPTPFCGRLDCRRRFERWKLPALTSALRALGKRLAVRLAEAV
jgi:hypothetical protein